MREPGLCGRRLLTRCLTSWRQGSLWGRPDPPSGVMCPRLKRRKISGCSRAVFKPSTGDLQSLENGHRDSHTWDRRVSASCGPERPHRLSRQWRRWRTSVGFSSCGSLKRCPSRQRDWQAIPWSCSSLPRLEATGKCGARFMSGDDHGSDSLDPTPRQAASRRVNRWLGEGLRQWKRSSQTSSVIPRIVTIGGIPCGGGALRPPSTALQMWPISFGGGGGNGWPRRWSTLWATLTLRWLGLWCFHGLWVAGLLVSVWLCCSPTCGVTPCMLIPKGSPRRRRWKSLPRCLRGLWYLFLIWMWRHIKGKWKTWSLIRILRPSPRSLRPPPCPQQAPVAPPRSPHRPMVRGNVLHNSRQEPDLGSGAARGSCDLREPARHREVAQERSTATVNRGPSGESLVWAVPYLSSGIMRRARRWAWVMQKPDGLPPRGGILMGLQSGLPAKWLCVPHRRIRAKAAVQRQANAGGGGAWKFAPRGGDSRNPICL